MHIPVIKKTRLVRSRKRVKGKIYIQTTLTIPRSFEQKVRDDEIVIIADDLILGIPPSILQRKTPDEIRKELELIITWLKMEVCRGAMRTGDGDGQPPEARSGGAPRG